jgi:hypothetical protein
MNRRLGAEISRMRSMWDSIETHCWPVDRLAAIVVCAGPWWTNKTRPETKANEHRAKDKLTLADVTDITQPPPDGCTDMRGHRTRHYVVTGFAYTGEGTRVKNPSHIRQSEARGYFLHYQGNTPNAFSNSKPRMFCRFSVWYIMRKDGAVMYAGGKYGSVMKNLRGREKELSH